MKKPLTSPTSADCNNALISALGDMPETFEALTKRLTPEVKLPTTEQRKMGVVPRFLALGAMEDVYIPTRENALLALSMQRMMVRGYMRRAPDPSYWLHHQAEARALADLNAPPAGRSSAPTFSIIGTSGRGKTTALDLAISLFPPCVRHDQAKNPLLPRHQIPIIKIQCPVNRTPRSFIMAFFDQILELTGIDYREGALRRANDDVLIVEMGRIARLHCIGLLVFDEVQEIVGKDDRLKRLLVRLTNTIKIPVIFAGTPKAGQLLNKELATARRMTGECWLPFERDDTEWNDVVDGLWAYQVTRTPTALTPPLKAKLHELSCGIPALAKSLYVFAQEHLIINSTPRDPERITPAILSEVFDDINDHLKLTQ